MTVLGYVFLWFCFVAGGFVGFWGGFFFFALIWVGFFVLFGGFLVD